MPAYNADRYVEQAVRSIQQQTLSNWEMIIVNDGSKDNTGNLADQFAADDPRIRVIHQNNSGQAAANNRAIPEAKSKYIARMDADDLAHPTRLEELVGELDSNPDLVCIGSNIWLCDAQGKRILQTRLPNTDTEIRNILLGKDRNCLCNPTVCFRKETWIRSGGERSCFGHAHDVDLYLRMAKLGKFKNLRQPLIDYRVHSQQVSIGSGTEQAICAFAAFFTNKRLKRTGQEPEFVARHNTVSWADLKNEGADELDLKKVFLQHMVDVHNRLCLLGKIADAAKLRAQVLTESRTADRGSLAKAQIIMLGSEIRFSNRLDRAIWLALTTLRWWPSAAKSIFSSKSLRI